MSDIIVVTETNINVVTIEENPVAITINGESEPDVITVAEGIQGPKGDKGETGEQGLKGDIGLQGVIGPQGIQGEPGPQGAKGDIGETGPQGIQGIKGDTGSTGLQGIQGIQGEIGPQGIQGVKGDKGDKGDTGEQGIQGIQGIQGEQGPAGTSSWGSISGTLSSQTDLQNALNAKADILTRKSALILESDFYQSGTQSIPSLTGTAISSGTTGTVTATANHLGVIYLRDSTTANGGYRYNTDTSAFLIAGGEKAVFVFQSRGVRSTASARFGFQDSTAIATAPTDGVWFEIVNDGTNSTITARCKNNAGPSSADAAYTLTTNTWYTAILEVNSDATSVNFRLLNDAGTVLWNKDITGNIPTASGRETGFGVIAGETTTDAAADIVHLDYLRMEINRTLIR